MHSRYQILGEINQGGVGVVLKAWDTKLSRHVAIKRFLSDEQLAAFGNVEGDLLKEASTLSSMQHPNIVSIYDVDIDAASGPEVIMEYLNGQDLEQAVSQAALTLEDFYQVAQQTLDALSNAHRMNLLHRDIKPSNIQVTWLANGKFVSKFVDFGLAKFFEKPAKQTVRRDGTVLGSVHYMAPEQFERLPLDHRSDIYSLGCVFYFALTMHRPFAGETVMDVINAHLHSRPARLRDYRPSVPRDLEKWLEWQMSRRPEARPADAELALTALRQIMVGQTADAVPGVRLKSQPVTAAPMRTGEARTPQCAAVSETGSRPKHTTPKLRTTSAGAPESSDRRKSSGAGKSLLVAGIAAAVAAGSFMLFSSDGNDKVTSAGTTSSAGDVPGSANREDELHRTKAELAAAQAQLAVRQASPDVTALSQAANPMDLMQPPSDGLLLWFDAGKGTRSDAGGKASVTNGPAAQWHDIAALGGKAVLQYTASTTKDKQEHFPLLRTVPAGAGLKSARPVISFDGTGDTLCLRDRDKTGDPVAATLDGGSVSALVVFRAAGCDAPEGLLMARTDKKQTLWSLGVTNKGLVAPPAMTKPLQIPGTETEFRIASFVMDAAAEKIHLNLISGDNQKVSAETRRTMDRAAHLEMLRMGTSDGSNNANRSVFAGDIAEILIYNRPLDRDSRGRAENYLRLKYFGSSEPTVTVNAGK